MGSPVCAADIPFLQPTLRSVVWKLLYGGYAQPRDEFGLSDVALGRWRKPVDSRAAETTGLSIIIRFHFPLTGTTGTAVRFCPCDPR